MLGKIFGRKKASLDSGFDFKIGPSLYLVKWDKYEAILGTDDPVMLMKLYAFRIWLWNYSYRRAVSDVDMLVKPMLYSLINEIKYVGNPIFLATALGMDKGQVAEYADRLMANIYETLELYDSFVVRGPNPESDGMDAAFAALAKKIGIDFESEDDVSKFVAVQRVLMEEVVEPAGDAALRFGRRAVAA